MENRSRKIAIRVDRFLRTATFVMYSRSVMETQSWAKLAVLSKNYFHPTPMLVRNIAARRRRGGEGESWTFGMMNAPVRGARFNHNFPVLLRVLSLSLSLFLGHTSGRRKCNCSSNSDDAGVIRIARANVLDSVCACISIARVRSSPPFSKTAMPDGRACADGFSDARNRRWNRPI